MSAGRRVPQGPFHEFKNIPIAKIRPNDENPRLDFPQNELDQLSQSIATKGLLVPVVVFEDPKKDDHFILTDGERRFRCARDLGIKVLPAVVTAAKSSEDNLVEMFNIHLVREPWRDMPTAWALEKLIESRQRRNLESGDTELASVTGLSSERIKRLRHALELPKQYQDYIHDERVPLNFFWELRVNVIEPLAKYRSKLLDELGRDNVTTAFVNKRLSSVITDTVALRKVRPIIAAAAKDAGAGEGPSLLDDTLRSLVADPDYTIEDAFEESVELMIEIGRLARKCENMVKGFERLLARASGEERKKVRDIGDRLIKNLSGVLKRRAR